MYMYFYTRLMLALDFVIPISSTSLPGGNLVDGLPPAASMRIWYRCDLCIHHMSKLRKNIK